MVIEACLCLGYLKSLVFVFYAQARVVYARAERRVCADTIIATDTDLS